MIKLLLLFV